MAYRLRSGRITEVTVRIEHPDTDSDQLITLDDMDEEAGMTIHMLGRTFEVSGEFGQCTTRWVDREHPPEVSTRIGAVWIHDDKHYRIVKVDEDRHGHLKFELERLGD